MEINLPYCKPGTDLGCYLEKRSGNVLEALADHIEMLEKSANRLKLISQMISRFKVGAITLDAYGHFINLKGPKNLLRKLLEERLADIDPIDIKLTVDKEIKVDNKEDKEDEEEI